MLEQMRAKDYIAKENILRLKWFRKNEEKLEQYANRPSIRTVPQETLEKREKIRKELVQQDRKVRKRVDDPIPTGYEGAQFNIMRPVDPDITRILYDDTSGRGRINYLKERVKSKPDDRFFFPECTSYVYGWKMWNYSKDNPSMFHYGKSKIVKTSFYRRRGTDKDPDWYKECAKLSPTVCGTI